MEDKVKDKSKSKQKYLSGKILWLICTSLGIENKQISPKLHTTSDRFSHWKRGAERIPIMQIDKLIEILTEEDKINKVSKETILKLEGDIKQVIKNSEIDTSFVNDIIESVNIKNLIDKALRNTLQYEISIIKKRKSDEFIIKSLKETNVANIKKSEASKLYTSNEPIKILYGIPELPNNYLIRTDYIESIKQAIYKEMVVGISGAKLGVHGMGGVGKTVIATAVARDEDILRHFPDGIYWITLGKAPNIINSQKNIFISSNSTIPEFYDAKGGLIRLKQYFENKKCLLILDDVWNVDHAKYFDIRSDKCCVLMTTRNKGIVHTFHAKPIQIDLLSFEESKKVIAKAANQSIEELPDYIEIVIKKCSRLFLALCIIGSSVQLDDNKSEAWRDILKKLYSSRKKHYERFDKDNPDYQYGNLAAAIEVSFSDIDDTFLNLYFDFAIFQEDSIIPKKALEALWVNRCKDPIEEDDVQYCLNLLVSRSLLTKHDGNLYSIHDIIYDYIKFKLQQEGILERHQILISSYERLKCGKQWHEGLNDGYFFQNICWHLKQLDQIEEINCILWNPEWYKVKIDYTNIYELISDFSFTEDKYLLLVKDALYLSACAINNDPSQLPSQLIGRLISLDYEKIKVLLNNLCSLNNNTWLRPILECLTPPGESCAKILAGHTNCVNYVAITPDGKKAVSASDDKSLRVWDLEKGAEVFSKPLIGHTFYINYVAITPDGRKAVSASLDNTLRVWDLEKGTEFFSEPLIGHTNSVYSVAITPDGRKAVSASEDKSLRVWDLEKGTEIFPESLTGHTKSVNYVAITPDGKKAVSASDDKSLRVWDLEKGTEVFCEPLTGHTNNVNSVAITSDGKKAVSTSYDNTVRVWDLEKGTKVFSEPLTGHTGFVTHVAITPDGRKAVSASRDKTLRVWDLEKGTEVFSEPLIGHSSTVTHVAITPDGRKAVSASRDKTLRVWDLEKGTEIFSKPHTGHTSFVTHVAITPDGKKAVSASDDKSLRVWDLEKDTEVFSRPRTGHTSFVTHVAITPDGKKAVSASRDKTLRVWDLEKGTEVFSEPLIGHADSVNYVAITPDGKKAVSASYDNTLRVWDLEKGTEVFSKLLSGYTGFVTHVAITPDGRKAVSASLNNTLRVWDLEKGTSIFYESLIGHTNSVNYVAITPDGRKAVSASRDKTLRVWDLEKGTEVFSEPLIGHTNSVYYVAITPDGRKAVSASEDKSLRVWDLEKGTEIFTESLTGHTNSVNYVAITSDENKAVSASDDKSWRIWELEKDIEVFCGPLIEHTKSVNYVAITPDGKKVVSASLDNTLRVWDLEKGAEVFSKPLIGHTNSVYYVAITPDGKKAVSASLDNTVRVWDLESGKGILTYSGDYSFECIDTNGKVIISGDEFGYVHILKIEI